MQYLGETFLYPVSGGRSLASASTDFQYFYPCNGATLPVNAGATGGACVGPPDGPTNLSLATLLGADTGASDATFTLPKLDPPVEGLEWFISNTGPMPTGRAIDDAMPLVGQISIHPTPSGGQTYSQAELEVCDGRLLYAPDSPTLFSLLGTTFGGDADQQTFMLPNIPAPAPSLVFTICTAGTVPPLVPIDQEAPA